MVAEEEAPLEGVHKAHYSKPLKEELEQDKHMGMAYKLGKELDNSHTQQSDNTEHSAKLTKNSMVVPALLSQVLQCYCSHDWDSSRRG